MFRVDGWCIAFAYAVESWQLPWHRERCFCAWRCPVRLDFLGFEFFDYAWPDVERVCSCWCVQWHVDQLADDVFGWQLLDDDNYDDDDGRGFGGRGYVDHWVEHDDAEPGRVLSNESVRSAVRCAVVVWRLV